VEGADGSEGIEVVVYGLKGCMMGVEGGAYKP